MKFPNRNILFSLFVLIAFQSCYQDNKSTKQKQEKTAIEQKQPLKSIEIAVLDTIETIDPSTKKVKLEIIKKMEEVYTIPRILPIFPGCKIQTDLEETYKCSKQHLTYFVSQNLSYPKQAVAKGLNGVSVVQFIIDENGIPYNEKIVKSIGHGTDKAVLNMIKKMRADKIIWTPGKVRDENVKVLHTLPVKFSLQN